MRAPALKEPFGPTLPELLAPRWRAASRRTRRAVIAAAAAFILVAAIGAIALPRDGWVVFHGHPVSFNLRYPRELHRVRPAPPGAYARIERRGAGGLLLADFEVRPLRLAPYGGEISGVLPVFAKRLIDRFAQSVPGFQLQSEGKARVNTTAGYTFTWRQRGGGGDRFGRVMLLLPQLSRVRDGVMLLMTTVPTASVTGPDQVAVNGLLQTPLRSFRFGT